MKSIGTMTIFYPFITSETRRIIKETMNESSDFSNLIFNLYEIVKLGSENHQLVFLTVMFCDRLAKHKELRDLSKLYWDNPFCRPYFLSELEKDGASVTHDDVFDSINNALKRNPEKWISMQLNIFLFYLAGLYRFGSLVEDQASNNIESLFIENPALECFLPFYYIIIARRLRIEGNSEEALMELKRARRISERYNDEWCLALSNFAKAINLSGYSMTPRGDTELKHLLKEVLETFKSFGDKKSVAMVLNSIGVSSAVRGELDDALDCYTQVIEILGEIDEPVLFEIPHNICMAHCYIGNGREALEWAKISLNEFESRSTGISNGHLNMVMAYILLDRLKDAADHLDIAKEYAFKSGIENELGWWYRVEGLLEKAKGNLRSAMQSFLASYDILSRLGRRSRIFMCLCDLAETEVALFEPTSGNRNNSYSGPWLQKAEEVIKKENLPGFITKLKIIQAELRMKQGRHEEAQSLVAEVLDVAEKLGLDYLKQQVIEKQSLTR